MTTYRIFPAIGIARLGESDDFFIGPEQPGSTGTELREDGTSPPVERFKDDTRTKVRKQGARFHLFESQDGVSWKPAQLPAGATVAWRVQLVNKKSAVDRPGSPPIQPTRPIVQNANAAMVIDGGTQTVSGDKAVSMPFYGTYKAVSAAGVPYQVRVTLGRLRTDWLGRLIVLGGDGFSSAPPGTPVGGSYYRNPRWHDDVADGPVTAEITLAPSQAPIAVEGGAWVIVAPPDYAPAIDCVVTLYDVLRQVGIDSLRAQPPGKPSFIRDIEPLIARVRRLRWVHADERWSDPDLASAELGDPSPAKKPLREHVRDLVFSVEEVFVGHTNANGPPFTVRQAQREALERWVNGDFDTAAIPAEAQPTADGLTRAALESAAGQGFCPGIEAGILMLDPAIYRKPFDFRIDHAVLGAGDITSLMAQPWQADFLKCNTEWWPTQRPDLAPQADGSLDEWIRGIASHRDLIERSGRLGFVVRKGVDEVFVEAERDPTL